MLNPFKTKLSWHQPGVFVPTKFLNLNFLLDESLRYYFDYDWMIRLLQKTSAFYLKELVAIFRYHQKSKTVNEKFFWLEELAIVLKRHWDQLSYEEKRTDRVLSGIEQGSKSSWCKTME